MCEKSMSLEAWRSHSGTLFALQIYGSPLCLCVTVHPLEGGQVAATSGPGGACQPHTVQQLTEDGGKKKKEGRQRVGSLEGRQRGSGRRKDPDVAGKARNCEVLCPSWAELHLLAGLQQEATSAS